MLEFLGFLLLIGIPVLVFGGMIWIARWLLKRYTGYDMGRDIDEAGHLIHSRDLDFLVQRDWLNQNYGASGRKKGAKSATSHYDRIVDEEWAEAQAAQRLSLDDSVNHDASEPVELGELLSEQKRRNQ